MKPPSAAQLAAHRAEVDRVRQALLRGDDETERHGSYPIRHVDDGRLADFEATDDEVGVTTDDDRGSW